MTGSAKWQVVSRESLLHCPPWFQVWREAVQLPDGRIIDDYHTIRGLEGVAIIAMTCEGEVYALSHYKHGIGEETLDLPGGYLDPGETAFEAAQRELREEVGCKAEEWHFLGRFVLEASRGYGAAHVYLALGVSPDPQPTTNPDLEETKVKKMKLDELVNALVEGQVKELASATAILLAKHKLETLWKGAPKHDR